LSAEHRDAPEGGCVVAALAPEVARHRVATRAFTTEVDLGLDVLVECLSRHRGADVSRAEGAALFGLLVGTLQLARTTADRQASDEILAAGVSAALRLARLNDSCA
jgi:TetR/AcrR family transcriptional repressor of nem operon